MNLKVKKLLLKDEWTELNFTEIHYHLSYLSIMRNTKNSFKLLATFFPNLMTLKLPFNQLKLNSSENHRFLLLQYLDLSYNEINDISILNTIITSQLYYLDLSANPIKILVENLYMIENLRIFKLAKIQILVINLNFLKTLKNLNELYLNNIFNLKVERKEDLKHLENLKKVVVESFRSCCLFQEFLPHPFQCNFRSKVAYNSCHHLLDDLAIKSLFWLFGIMGVFLNIFSFIAIFAAGKSTIRIYKFSITFMDLITSFYFLTIACVDQYYKGIYMIHDEEWRESYLCKSLGIILQFTIIFSTIILLLLTKERSNAIINPFSISFIKRFRIFIISAAFFISAFLAFFPFLFKKV